MLSLLHAGGFGTLAQAGSRDNRRGPLRRASLAVLIEPLQAQLLTETIRIVDPGCWVIHHKQRSIVQLALSGTRHGANMQCVPHLGHRLTNGKSSVVVTNWKLGWLLEDRSCRVGPNFVSVRYPRCWLTGRTKLSSHSLMMSTGTDRFRALLC